MNQFKDWIKKKGKLKYIQKKGLSKNIKFIIEDF